LREGGLARLRNHNARQNPSTARHKPWEVLVSVEFKSQETGVSFEQYLKSGSGRAFARRHFR
jgi:predicted GIY-YIG superfamily endonuclease